jgi:hypothetical protein
MQLELKKLGKVEARLPDSLATCLDFVSIWGSDPSRAQLGRLCAATIGVCSDHAKVLPAYPVATGDPIAYGHKIMDRLLDAGVVPAYVYTMGSELLIKMIEELPKEEEVEDKTNFSTPLGEL